MSKKVKLPLSFRFGDPLFLCTIMVIVGGEQAAAEKKLSKFLEVDCRSDRKRYAATYHGNSKDVGIYFSVLPGGATVAHEALHASWHILERSGVVIGRESEEAMAYHFDWLIRQIGRRLWL